MRSLFSLPPEVRRMIYRELLVSKSPVDILNLSYCYRALVPKQEPCIWPQVLRVCKCLFNEAVELLYQNTFTIRMTCRIQDAIRYYAAMSKCRPRVMPDGTKSFIARSILLRKQRKLVHKIRFSFETVKPARHWLMDNALHSDVQLIDCHAILSQLGCLTLILLDPVDGIEQPKDWMPAAGGDLSLATAMANLMNWYKRTVGQNVEDELQAAR